MYRFDWTHEPKLGLIGPDSYYRKMIAGFQDLGEFRILI